MKTTGKPTIAVIGTRGFPAVQGGVEVHCERIYTRMRDVRIKVYRRMPYLNDKSRAATYPDIEFIDLRSTRIKGFEALYHTFVCACRCIASRPDVVHVHNIGPGMFNPLLRLFGLKVVMTYHSANYEHAKWGAMSRLMLRWCERVSLRYANRVIFVNKFRMERFPESIRNKATYIPNGITQAKPTTDTSFLSRHGIKPNNYILAVGRLTPEKGFEQLITAVNNLHRDLTLVIAGAADHDPGYARKLQALDTKHRVIFTGFAATEQLQQLYSHAQLFVLSSLAEGFPLVLLEAMNNHIPIIASDIDATHLIELPAENYFKPADTDDLARCLERKLATPPQATHYDLSEYDWNRIASQTQKILLEKQ